MNSRRSFLRNSLAVSALPLLARAVPQTVATGRAKYVFYLIGDGMGIVQRQVSEYLLRHIKQDPKLRLAMNQLPVQGLTTTQASDFPITDSAASGTALACGVKTANGRISVLPNGKAVRSIAEDARDAGMRVGIVSTVSIDHATPAVFYSHQDSRNNYYEIACDLGRSGFDYFGGGQARGEQPDQQRGRPSVVGLARDNGYQIVDSVAALRRAQPGGKVWASSPVVDPAAALPYEIDKVPGAIPLAEFVKEGIRLLDNPQGFFLMIESGKIDWACHANDPMSTVGETLAFDQSLALVLEFLKQHPKETLVVVTADHECGGMTFGRTFTGYDFHCEPIARQPVSYDKLMVLAERMRRNRSSHYEASMELCETMGFGILNKWEDDVLGAGLEMTKQAPEYRYWDLHATQDFGKKEPLAEACLRIVSARSGVAWGSFTHNGTPVQTSAVGVEAERFSGFYDNTDLCSRLRAAMGLA